MASSGGGISGFLKFYRTILTKITQFKKNYPKVFLSIKIFLGLGVLGLVFVVFMGVMVWRGTFGVLPSYPDLRNIKNATASEIYDRSGELLGKYYFENRVNANLEEIPDFVINALVATEDARFFRHGGIDFRAWMRVLFKSVLLFDASSGGGSTLSQQLAKNVYGRQQYPAFSMLINKMREAFIARRLEQIYTKEELLKLYLNTVSFSENIFGIKVAANRFFGKKLKEVSVEEAALLIGTLKGTSYYNPVKHPERATTRRNTVLSQMAKYDYLPVSELDSLQHIPVELSFQQEGDNQGVATYFRSQVMKKAEEVLKTYKKPDGSPYNLRTDGLKIFTTLDARMQRYAEAAVKAHLPVLQKAFEKEWKGRIPWNKMTAFESAVRNSKRYQSLTKAGYSQEEIVAIFKKPIPMQVFSWEAGTEKRVMSPLDSVKYYMSLLNVGMLLADPRSGAVKVWIGGINHQYLPYDHVKSRRQVGSTFKPIVYAQALRQGMLPCEYTSNELVKYADYDDWMPENAEGEYEGVYSMEGALSHSVNTVAVAVAIRAGLEGIRGLAQKMGIEGKEPEGPAIALGTVDASLWEMTKVYSVFANRGSRSELYYLDRIETADGRVIVAMDPPDPEGFEVVLENGQADMVRKMLESVIDSGTAKRLLYKYQLKGNWAGKTGTTQNQSDGWFMGFNPMLVGGVWVGASSPQVHFRTTHNGQGANTALPIWGMTVRKIELDEKYKEIRNAEFVALQDTLLALMSCPPYLDEMPVLDIVDELLNADPNLQFIDREKLDSLIHQFPRKYEESASTYSQRIQKHNERIDRKRQRQANRKRFLEKLGLKKKRRN